MGPDPNPATPRAFSFLGLEITGLSGWGWRAREGTGGHGSSAGSWRRSRLIGGQPCWQHRVGQPPRLRLLQRSICAGGRAAVAPRDRLGDRAGARRSAHRQSWAQSRAQGHLRHRPGAPAQVASTSRCPDAPDSRPRSTGIRSPATQPTGVVSHPVVPEASLFVAFLAGVPVAAHTDVYRAFARCWLRGMPRSSNKGGDIQLLDLPLNQHTQCRGNGRMRTKSG